MKDYNRGAFSLACGSLRVSNVSNHAICTALISTQKTMIDQIVQALGDKKAEYLLTHTSRSIAKEMFHLPGADFVERVFFPSNRNTRVLSSISRIYHHGRLNGTGYVSILPVDQGVEHSAGASFASNPEYFDPENIVQLAIEGGCNAVASTFGVLGAVARRYAHKIPFLVKINHNELLTYPNQYKEVLFGTVKQAYELGATAVGATVYFGSLDASREIVEISEAFALAHELGMATVLWCYLRNSSFIKGDKDYHFSADLTGQANYLGTTIQADFIKQKLPVNNGGFLALKSDKGDKKGTSSSYGGRDEGVYSKLTGTHPIDLCRYQVANCLMGRIGLINSGGASGNNDFAEAIYTAVINKRAGGQGLISGRKAFQRPMKEGISLLHAIQDVYLCREITVA